MSLIRESPATEAIYAVLETLAARSVGMPVKRYEVMLESLIEILKVMRSAAANPGDNPMTEPTEDFPP